MGGGGRGFSKLAPWLEGKRGLAGGLVMVVKVLWLPVADALLGINKLSPDCEGSCTLA